MSFPEDRGRMIDMFDTQEGLNVVPSATLEDMQELDRRKHDPSGKQCVRFDIVPASQFKRYVPPKESLRIDGWFDPEDIPF